MTSEELKNELTSNIVRVDNMRDYRNDPFFQRKLKEAKEFIAKHGLPEDMMTKKEDR